MTKPSEAPHGPDPQAAPTVPPGPAPQASPGVVPTSVTPSATGPVYPGQPAPTPSRGLPPTQPAPPSYDPTLLPASGQHAMGPAAAPAADGGRTTVALLSVLLGLFVLASGTLGALYVRQGQESTRKSEQIATLEAANDGALRQLNAAERDLRGADEDLTDVKTERDAIAQCLTGIYDWWDALDETGGVATPDTEEVWLEASRLCRAAEQYL